MKNKCCLCGEEFEGYGNDPAPLKDSGECCGRCNAEKVIPAGLEALLMPGENADEFAQ